MGTKFICSSFIFLHNLSHFSCLSYRQSFTTPQHTNPSLPSHCFLSQKCLSLPLLINLLNSGLYYIFYVLMVLDKVIIMVIDNKYLSSSCPNYFWMCMKKILSIIPAAKIAINIQFYSDFLNSLIFLCITQKITHEARIYKTHIHTQFHIFSPTSHIH